jgi:hypothetical protein
MLCDQKTRVHESYSWYTARPQTLPTLLCWSISQRQTLIPPLDSNRLVALLLICLYSEDRQTYQHITQHNTPYDVFSHKCIPVLCNLFTSYIDSDSTSMSLKRNYSQKKTQSLIVPQTLVPIQYPLFCCNKSLAICQTQRKINRLSQSSEL